MEPKRKAEISEAIRNYRSPDSIIAYLFSSLENEKIPTDEGKLHSSIFELKKEYPDFFEDFTFSQGNIYPFSKELERVLFRFQQSLILGTINPTMEFFTFSDKSKKIVKQHYSDKFNGDERDKLAKMGQRLQQLLYG